MLLIFNLILLWSEYRKLIPQIVSFNEHSICTWKALVFCIVEYTVNFNVQMLIVLLKSSIFLLILSFSINYWDVLQFQLWLPLCLFYFCQFLLHIFLKLFKCIHVYNCYVFLLNALFIIVLYQLSCAYFLHVMYFLILLISRHLLFKLRIL